jgi:hypothetical protein
MITNDGKQIIAKYLLGQAPEFASHLAAGCGPRPLEVNASASYNPERQSLDFEMFRVPIFSKGFIREDGEEKIVFKAEMPTDKFYRISEVAVFPAKGNSIAGEYDSKSLVTFLQTEQWSSFENSISNQSSGSSIFFESALGESNTVANIREDIGNVFFARSNDDIYLNPNRIQRQEAPRFLNRSLFLKGDSSNVSSSGALIRGEEEREFNNFGVQNSTFNFDLSRNFPSDKIKLAFSTISRDSSTSTAPKNVRILLEFYNNLRSSSLGIVENIIVSPKARALYEIDRSTLNSSDQRYAVLSKNISDFAKEENFSWTNINYVRAYISVFSENTNIITNLQVVGNEVTITLANSHKLYKGMRFAVSGLNEYFSRSDLDGSNVLVDSATSSTIKYLITDSAADIESEALLEEVNIFYDAPSSDYYVALDGIRIDNESYKNPIYSMVGYNIINSPSRIPIVKNENTNNYIEYRFGVGVV